jgi:hypothetical protein
MLVKAGRYRVTLHAEQERDADQILTSEIEKAFTDRESVVLEDYPDDSREHSALVLGFTKMMEPLHGVWSIHEKTAILVTIYHRIQDCGPIGGNGRGGEHEVLSILQSSDQTQNDRACP